MFILNLKKTVHKNQERIKLEYRYEKDGLLDGLVRNFPERKWSRTMQCWHIPDCEKYKDLVKEHFKHPN